MNRHWTEGTDRVLDFVTSTRWEALPGAVQHQSRRCLLDLTGALVAGRRFVVLAAALLGYQTLAAMVFAGTPRYRAPWDFLLALLAGIAFVRLWEWRRR
jgi:hypothetical protein